MPAITIDSVVTDAKPAITYAGIILFKIISSLILILMSLQER